MHSGSTIFVIIAIISIFFSTIPLCSCQKGYQYVTCGAWFHCANIQNMSYPFWGLYRPDYCGRRPFHLTNCRGDIALLRIGSIEYRVISMDKPTRSITLARSDIDDRNCPSFPVKTTLDSAHFTLSPTNRVINLYYGCTMGQFNCTDNVRSDADPAGTDVASCRGNVSVLVSEKWGEVLGSGSASQTDLGAALASGFRVELRNDSLCDRCMDSGGRCGLETRLDPFVCYCADGRVYDYICNITSQSQYVLSEQLTTVRSLVVGFSVSGGVLTLIILGIIYNRRRQFNTKKNEETDDENIEIFLMNHGSFAPKRYSYNDIKKITNSFADKLGEGGYGIVYKGKLPDGRFAAVKILSEAHTDGGNFVNEVASISRTSHVNIVTLLGFCMEKNNRALIYEFMPNKSLDKFIRKNRPSSLNRETLYKIAVGTARGLDYLHRGCNTRIVHFDIKPENILLDEEFCPKISDFGLAKLCQRKKSVVTMMGARGTPGYIAPEVFCRNFGQVSHKSDVYSYGMMVINMLGLGGKNEDELSLDGAKSEMYFPEYIYKQLELGLLSEDGEEPAKKMVMVGLWCIQMNPSDRPSMSKVVEMLEGNLESIQIPTNPILFSPLKMDQDSLSEFSSDEEILLIKSENQRFSPRKSNKRHPKQITK